MKFIFPELIFTGFILALYFIIIILRRKEWKYKESRLFMALCLASATWSFGFFGVMIQTIPDKAYKWRAIGMVGTFAYLITAQYLICYFSDVQNIYRRIAEYFSLTGIIIFFFVIQKEQTTYKLDKIGMTYSFNSGIWNTLYILYTVIVALNMILFTIYMIRKGKTQQRKELGRKLFVTELVIVVGMLFDTIFPIVGMSAYPGSTLTQFLGLAVMFHTFVFVSHSRITIDNMSEFIYYSLTAPVLVYDSNYELQILNDTAYSFFNVPKDNLSLSNTDIENFFDLDKEDVFDFENKAHVLDGVCKVNNLNCNLSINKIYDNYDDIIGYIILISDLSERMKAINELEEAIKEAEYANQAKSIFLANTSHEIRTPMNAIIGFSELILKMDIDEQVREYVEDIKFSSLNLLAIINDILDISKIESGKMELIPDNYYTGTLLNDISLIIAPQAEKKGLRFHMNVDENIPRELFGDKTRVRGILINILNNAVKYTQEGEVSFTASIINMTAYNIKLEFKITDTGIGIHPENLDKLFNSFERLDQKLHYGIEGSGLGLAISNGFINLMGGDIFVDSTYGKGSTFTVILEQGIIDSRPLSKSYSQKKDALNNISLSDLKINGLKVLVTDDNLVNLKVAHGILSYYGLIVDTASSGKDAIELCKKTDYAIVFMDQMMPEIDGIEAMKQIRQIRPYYNSGGKGKIIVLTADAIKGTRETLIEKGFDEYLGKPINVAQLERILLQFIPASSIHENDNIDTLENDNTEITSGDDEILNYLKDNLTMVNIPKGINNCGNNIENYLQILKITYDYGEKQLEELRTAFNEKDYELYIIKIHSIKSTALNIGAEELSAKARNQEEKGRAGEFSYIDEHMESFQTKYHEFLDKLEIVLKHFDIIKDISSTENVEVLDDTSAAYILKNINRYIESFDFAKVFEIFEECKKYKLSEKYRKLLAQTEELMENMDVDKIQELLSEVINNKTI